MQIVEPIVKRFEAFAASLVALQADLELLRGSVKDSAKQESIGNLVVLIRGKLAAIGNQGMLEVEGGEARFEAGLRAFEELKVRKDLLTERMGTLRKRLEEAKP